MKIVIGSDHGGFELKEEIKEYLNSLKYDILDVGCFDDKSCDYPEIGKKVARSVVDKKTFGIVVCGTGIGISIAVNKIFGARCALCTTSTHAKLAREHNDANILALGGRITGFELAKDIIQTFLETKFSNEPRHKNRILKIENEN